MVTTPAPTHPLRAGAVPATLWSALTVVDLALPIALFGFALPHIALLHGDPIRLGWSVLTLCVALIAVMATCRWARAAVRIRVPGGLRRSTITDPAPGPGTIDMFLAALGGLGYLVGITTGIATVRTDPAAMLFVLAAVAYLSSAMITVYGWRIGVATYLRQPGGRREVAIATLSQGIPSIVAIVASVTVAPSGPERSLVMLTGLVTVFVVLTIKFVAHVSLARVAPQAGQGVRREARGFVEAIADVILSRTNAAPTITDRSSTENVVRIGLWSGGALLAAFVLAMTFA